MMIGMSKGRQVLIVAVAVAVVSGVGAYFIREPDLTERARASALRGGAWLFGYEGKLVDPGVLWIMKTVNETYCADPRIQPLIERRFSEEFSENPATAAYGVMLGIVPTIPADYYRGLGKELSFDDAIIPAYTCDRFPLSQNVIDHLLGTRASGGYDLTHRYLALLFIKQRGCAYPGNLARDLEDAAALMADEEKGSFVSDVSIERVAFLLYGGFGGLVTDDQVKGIVARQDPSGGWRAGYAIPDFGTDVNPHTTALAVWALSQYSGHCPFR